VSRAFRLRGVNDPEAKRRMQTPVAVHISSLIDTLDMEVIPVKSAFAILAAAVLLLGATTAQAARPTGSNSNIILSPPTPLQSSVPPMTNSGALDTPLPLGTPQVNSGALGLTSPSALGVPGQQSFGALPGNPGSATYDPNAALPSLGNSGSAIAPDQGSSATGLTTPSTGVNTLNTNVNGGM
jgi:hypothetical protein